MLTACSTVDEISSSTRPGGITVGTDHVACDDHRGKAGDTEVQQLADQRGADRQCTRVSRVALDLTLAAAVMADVELDVDLGRASPPLVQVSDKRLTALQRERGGRERERQRCLWRPS